MHILFLELQIPKKDWNATNSRTAMVLSLFHIFHTYFISYYFSRSLLSIYV